MKKALIFTVLVLAGLCLFLYKSRPAPNAAEFVSGLTQLSPEMHLVVAKLDFTETAQADSPKTIWGVDLGTTRASVSVHSRARYSVDLSGNGVTLNLDARRILTAVFPDPQVDSVELFLRDRRTLVQPGWGRLGVFSGQALLDKLDRGLYDAAKARAGTPAELAEVREIARARLIKLAEDYARQLGAGRVTVVVRFRSELSVFGPAAAA